MSIALRALRLLVSCLAASAGATMIAACSGGASAGMSNSTRSAGGGMSGEAGAGGSGAGDASGAGNTNGGGQGSGSSSGGGANPDADIEDDSSGSPGNGSGTPDANANSGGRTDASASDADAKVGSAADATSSIAPSADGGVPLSPAQLANCTGASPIVCAIDVPNGNYNVTVDLGSATAAATTRVQAELLRIELQPTATAAGMFFPYTFTVNVRTEVHNTYSAPGNVLNLLFDGTAPALHGLGVAAAPASITVFVAGDSTVCDWDPTASDAITPPTPSIERGWAQELSQYLNPGVAVANYAVSGQTAGGFYAAYFPAARADMKAGDYLFVQFGHNDQKSAADIASYQANLTKYITDAQAKNVTPVIFTPVARGTGPNFAGLDQQARDLAAAQNVALIDLTNLAWAYYQTLPDKTVLFVPGQETHFTESGATQIAGIVAQALKTSKLGLAAYVK